MSGKIIQPQKPPNCTAKVPDTSCIQDSNPFELIEVLFTRLVCLPSYLCQGRWWGRTGARRMSARRGWSKYSCEGAPKFLSRKVVSNLSLVWVVRLLCQVVWAPRVFRTSQAKIWDISAFVLIYNENVMRRRALRG